MLEDVHLDICVKCLILIKIEVCREILVTFSSVKYVTFHAAVLQLAFQSQSHITTDNQSAIPSLCQAPIWDQRPLFLSPSEFILDSFGLLFCRALSDERTGL
jgi:hypothetical protein